MPSRHPRRASLPDGLFRDIRSFHELETRIAALTEEQTRGDALEVFVEAYLWTTAVWQVADLWLVGDVPLDVRRTLNLPADAKGIDGVLRTRPGVLVPYQVKFRIGRPKVGVAEVSTFLGLTERAEDRLLISNADRHAGDIENRDRLRLLRGTDFDALAQEDLAALCEWLEARPSTRERWTPREDQRLALDKIAHTLTTHDRATVVMPCGTGKTLVQLWAAEQQQPDTVLVLVPSLALLGQTLDEWSRHTAWGTRFEYLCVCSDPSVAAEQDALQVRTTEVPFHVDTDPDVVRRFLGRPSTGTVRVVFSTYQSAPVVADGLRGLSPIDLGIFDEAHKSAGLRDGVFGFALDDARLPIRTRLFFTATPRHLDIRHRDKEGDFPIVSMDNPTVYGPRTYTQTFAEAVERGIICDYRVVVSVVDPKEVSAFAIQHGITLVEGDQQGTQWVATQIAVSKAIAKTGATKVITFHSRVKQAQDFASPTPRGIGQYLHGFVVDHVNGQQRVADRNGILAGFKDVRRRLVTNARCLTEGVNLPAVDMVAFGNPRKSRVDIVQAVGRAMRKPKDGTKDIGYVVVPILLAPHQTEDITDACADTAWEDVVDVLQALREHDTRLDEIIREQLVAKGRAGVFNPRAFVEHVQVLGPLVSLEVLEGHISSVILARLGVSWDERYGQLTVFRESHGHCDVPRDYPDLPQLPTWLTNQRAFRRRGSLSPERVARLDELGVVWDPYEAWWAERYQELVEFKARFGHCNVPQRYPENPPLATWLDSQRTKRDSLSPARIAQLDALGIVWDPREAYRETRLQELTAFKARNGHCDVPRGYPDNPKLAIWLQGIRDAKRRGTLAPHHAARLEELGVNWEPSDSTWEKRFRELQAFNATNGHCNVPAQYPNNRQLGIWLGRQRTVKKKGTIHPDYAARLDAMGVVWDFRRPTEAARRRWSWDDRYDELAHFHARHGHCNLRSSRPYNHHLDIWLAAQCAARARGKLSSDRILRLNALGIEWESVDNRWEERFQELCAYQAQHGHCEVPAVYEASPQLGTWLRNQRRAKKAGSLSAERIARLARIGVSWDVGENKWQKYFQQLAAFKEQHGHCNVPHLAPTNRSLSMWLAAQRQYKKGGRLSQERAARLEALGVVWRPSNRN